MSCGELPMTAVQTISAEIAPGELIDKITILDIKSERIADPEKLANVHAELATLESARTLAVEPSEQLADLTSQLKLVNEAVW